MSHSIHVIIIGAGICGLGAAISIALQGHRVSVFETAPHLHTAGAGVQITPNGIRILRRLGVANELAKKAAVAETFSIIRFDGQKVLAHRDRYNEELERKYAEPVWCLHRVDLQTVLAARSEGLGVKLHFDACVTGIDFTRPALTLHDGRIVQGDLIIATDGLWSASRGFLSGSPLPPNPTNDLAYRIVLTTDDVGEDEEIRNLMRRPGLRIWMGSGAHAVSYSLRAGEMLNVVLLAPDDIPLGKAREQGNVAEMMKLFEGWDPLLTRCLSRVQHVDKWRLMSLRLDKPWHSQEGTFVMAGDSCHPMLPYLAQGANLALEDGATLGILLGGLQSTSQIPEIVKKYYTLRKDRATKIQNEAFKNQKEFHLPDGPSQEARDKELAKSFDKQDGNDWTHPKVQPWVFGYNVYEEVCGAEAA